MKIGILTFHHSRNYGAVLQAYGLKEVLCGMGHSVEVIDYRPQSIDDRKSPFAAKRFFANPFRYITLFFNIYPAYRKSVVNFTTFEKDKLCITSNIFKPEYIQSSDYDAIVIGSDQVWSPIITNGPDPVFWGAYKPKRAKLITYGASSCAIKELGTDNFIDVGQWLARFDAISVREQRLKEYVEKHSSQTAEVVVDPTLLAGKDAFECIAAPRVVKEPYILVYRVEKSITLLPIARRVAELYHAKIVCIAAQGITGKLKGWINGITYINASVEEMLSLVKHAECVVALSFHGTALSLLFEKDFYSIKGKNMARVEAVLEHCNLNKRIVDSPNIPFVSHIDYSIVKPQLCALQQHSYDWLNNALK